LSIHAVALEFLYSVVGFKFKRGFKISFENALKFGKRKIKRFLIPSLAFGPSAQPAAHRSPSFLPRAFRFSPFPRFPLWAEPSHQPSACAAPSLSLSLVDVAGPQVRAAFLLKPSATTLSKITGGRIRFLILFFLFWSGSGAI
jgi:hypothetical protein